jgi:hypothetical protein
VDEIPDRSLEERKRVRMPYMFLIDDRVRKSGDTTIWIVSGIEPGGMHYRILQRSDPAVTLMDRVAEDELVYDFSRPPVA